MLVPSDSGVLPKASDIEIGLAFVLKEVPISLVSDDCICRVPLCMDDEEGIAGLNVRVTSLALLEKTLALVML